MTKQSMTLDGMEIWMNPDLVDDRFPLHRRMILLPGKVLTSMGNHLVITMIIGFTLFSIFCMVVNRIYAK